jgi:hypothetical protein
MLLSISKKNPITLFNVGESPIFILEQSSLFVLKINFSLEQTLNSPNNSLFIPFRLCWANRWSGTKKRQPTCLVLNQTKPKLVEISNQHLTASLLDFFVSQFTWSVASRRLDCFAYPDRPVSLPMHHWFKVLAICGGYLLGSTEISTKSKWFWEFKVHFKPNRRFWSKIELSLKFKDQKWTFFFNVCWKKNMSILTMDRR